VSATAEGPTSAKPLLPWEWAGCRLRAIGVVRQWFGLNGDFFGPNGRLKQTFVYSLGITAATVGAINALNVIAILHESPRLNIMEPMIWEGSSWLTFVLFLWVVWVAWRMAPPKVCPRWKLLIHIPMALAFSFMRVSSFVFLRKFIYWLAGGHYVEGPTVSQFLYEFSKDIFGYVFVFACFTLVHHLLHQRDLSGTQVEATTFDIRDGAKFVRAKFDEILALTSAGNYVEFLLMDGRRLLMRSPLSTIEPELAPKGFLRTHRSWLINTKRVTGLRPEGSGDCAVELRADPRSWDSRAVGCSGQAS
jgi:hypothetical protein